MKKSMIGLSILAVGLLSACQKDDVTTEKGGNAKGSTYATINVKAASPFEAALNQTRAGVTDKGTTDESTVGKIWFVAQPNESRDFNAVSGSDNRWSTNPFKTEPGQRTFGIVLNGKNTDLNLEATNLDASTLALKSTTDLVTGITALTTKENFVMSSEILNKLVKAGVKENEVTSTNGEAKNYFKADAERLVCKGVVQTADGFDYKIQDNTGEIKTTDLAFAGVNGATNTFLYKNHAGTQETADLLGSFVYKYNDYVSSIDGITSTDDFENADNAVAAGLVRLGNVGESAKLGASSPNAYTAQLVNTYADRSSNDKIGDAKAVYFMENSWSAMPKKAGEKVKGMYRLAYAKIYGTVTPTTVMYVTDKGELTEGGNQIVTKNNGTFYMLAQGKTVYADKVAAGFDIAKTDAEVAKLRDAYVAALKIETVEEPAQGKYTEEQKKTEVKKTHDALFEAVKGRVYTYTNGRCGYYALWNQKVEDQSGEQVVTYADTRRNNTYVVTIKSFQTIGFPWDPSDPNDPNLPKPKKDEPTPGKNNPDPDKSKTFMDIDVTVAPWNVVAHEIDLSL